MAHKLQGKRVAFLATDMVEQVELTEPWKAVKEAGGTPVLIAPEAGEVQTFNHLDKSATYPVDVTLGDAKPADYAGVVLPGGVVRRRVYRPAVRRTTEYVEEEPPPPPPAP